MVAHAFDVWDYVSMVAMVVLSTGVAFYHVFKVKKDKSKSTKEFLVTGKGIGFFPIVLSTVASSISPVTVQSYPYEIYSHGIMFAIFIITPYLSLFLFSRMILPVYYNLGISSVFQYLEYRFSRSVRLMASIISTCQMTLYTSCVIYAPSLAISQVTGIHLWTSVLTIGVVCIIYTSLGGIKAVIWADALQFMVMIAVNVTIVIKGCIDVGGVGEVLTRAWDGYRLKFFFTGHEYSNDTVITFLLGGTLLFLVFVTPNQMFIQRLLANSNIETARWSLLASSMIMSSFMFMVCFLGILMYARYWDCDPKLDYRIETGDQLVPYYALQTLSFVKGLPGIFVSGILCACLSTLSSVLNSLATVTLVDYITPFYPNLSEKRTMVLSKVLAAVYGVVCVALVSVAENLGGIVRAIFALSGAIGGPLLGVFLLGIFFPWANNKGALAGFISSLAICSWATAGHLMYAANIPHLPISVAGCNASLEINSTANPIDQSFASLNQSMEVDVTSAILEYPGGGGFFLYEMSTMWYSGVALAVTFVVGMAVSILTGVQNPEQLEASVISPQVESLFRSLPEKYRLFFGYKSDKMRPTKWSMKYMGNEPFEMTIPLDLGNEKDQSAANDVIN